ncbi:integrator complex subunit 6-like [Xenia sp. Carnegie-2017]|uniref:integrator complex subunit 6-like n=1 Tax=Xenia sp. Carnegie-2017 TaxID=2897299 RepID=UPI001F04BFC1|nr:integrator complex subunit 6-like [Xenia sp. Carnegie-2017]
MGIILFLVDTSASMSQRTFLGTTLIDIGKGAVETFIKLRQRDQGSRTDRYMLMTSDEIGAIKAGWKENLATFMNELKNLQATGLTNLGSAMKQAFDLLNLYRLQSGIDNYGMGRNPFYLDPAMVICITDGGKLSSIDRVHQTLELPLEPRAPGSELTKEPFRWDQRLFSLILKFPGSPNGFDRTAGVNADVTNEYLITPMCDATGGRSYIITTPKSLSNVVDALVQKFQMGVVINFEKIGGPDKPAEANSSTVNSDMEGEGKPKNHANVSKPPSDMSGQPTNDDAGQSRDEQQASRNTSSPLPPTVLNNLWYSCRRLIYIKTNPKVNTPVGHWPIPESFWPEHSMSQLEPRDADPTVLFSCVNSEPMVMDLLPFDKYELERSPLTQYILENVKPTHCWQTYVSGSGKNSELGYPFGYLKASVNFQAVNLFVMPYNYPILIPLLDELFKVLKLSPTPKWRQLFDKYLSDLPSYYIVPLRTALRRMGANVNLLIPDHVESSSSLSNSIQSYLKKLKQQAKVEADKVLSGIGKKAPGEFGRPVSQINNSPLSPNSLQKRDFHEVFHNIPSSQPSTIPEIANVTNLPDFKELPKMHQYKNPFDIKRSELLDQLARMRINFFHTAPTATRLQDQDSRHSIAISQMGNYQDYLKQTSPLRELDPGMNRAHMFGNPFKLAKDQPMMVDEADVVNEAVAGGGSSRKRRDIRSPSPRDRRRKPDVNPNNSKRPTQPQPMQENVHQPLPPITPPLSNFGQPPVITGEKPSSHNVKAPVPGKKRKLQEGEGSNEQRKQSKPSVNPQLRKLQQLHHNKQHGQASSAFTTAGQAGMSKDKLESSKDISSILRNACLGPNATNSKALSNTPEIKQSNHDLPNDKNDKVGLRRKEVSKSIALRKMYEKNTKLRQMICKQIRTLGQDPDPIIGHLEQVQGSLEKRREFTRTIIDEAARFKKNKLVEILNVWLNGQEQKTSGRNRRAIKSALVITGNIK